MSVTHSLLVGQYIPSGTGFKIIRVTEEINSNRRTGLLNSPQWMDARQWCKMNCSGIWGHGTMPRIENVSNNWKDGTRAVGYLAFLEQIDITAVCYYMGLQHVTANTLWPSSMKFNIYYPKELDID